MNPQNHFNPRHLFCWQIILIVLLTASVYGKAIGFNFVNYDDDGYVYQNQHILDGLSLGGAAWAFSGIYKANYIPLTLISYMADSSIFGRSPAGYHFTNILLHILNALLVFYFLKTTTNRPWAAFVTAMLFAVHPLHVESVAWISERKDVLSTFFGLLSLISYAKYAAQKSVKTYLAVFFLFLCSLLAKPMLVTMPILFLLLDFWPLERVFSVHIAGNRMRIWAVVLEKLPFLMLSLVIGIIAVLGQKSGGALGTDAEFPFSIRLANAIVAYGVYIVKTIWPINLAVIYPYSAHIRIFRVLFNLFALILISGWAVFRRNQNPALIMGWLWFLITLLPVIGLIQVGTQAMADRYTYVPLIGLFIVGVWGLHELILKFRIRFWVAAFAASGIIAALSMMAIHQVAVWKDSETLFSHALFVTRNNWVAHLNYGEALMENGRMDDAINQYQQAITINPGFELAYVDMGAVFAKKGQPDAAIDYYQKALAIRQNLPVAWLNMGNAYFRKGMPDKALSHYKTALSYKPDYAEAYCGIGAVMAGKGDLQKAMQAFQQAIDIDPGLAQAENAITRIKLNINNNNK